MAVDNRVRLVHLEPRPTNGIHDFRDLIFG